MKVPIFACGGVCVPALADESLDVSKYKKTLERLFVNCDVYIDLISYENLWCFLVYVANERNDFCSINASGRFEYVNVKYCQIHKSIFKEI